MADLQQEAVIDHSAGVASLQRPFVGLRPFAYKDATFYFGRKEQTDRLAQLLLVSRMISVVGSSGSGKSSLVRAGLLPRITSAQTSGPEGWEWVEMRPGEAPIRNLAEALAQPQRFGEPIYDPLADARADRMELLLRESSFGIRDSLNELAGSQVRRLVILVDQFEEIFRFADLRERHSVDPRLAAEQRDEATQFIQLLLAATDDPGFAGRIILTMRSDFIGECARFHGLSEAVTASQYLVPALTRDQRAVAIRGPVEAAGGTIEPALVQRLLNETNEDLDQLPVLQHTMMRCWQHAATRQGQAPHLTLDDYAAVGGIENALTHHADELLAELHREDLIYVGMFAQDHVARRIFQCLTDTDSQGRTIRRPQTVGDLTSVIVADSADDNEIAVAASAVRQVIARFADPDCSFLRVPPLEDITNATVVDIGHEALIRRWERLGGQDPKSWVHEEKQDGERYSDLVRLADIGSPIEAARLPGYLDWWQQRQPNRCWARRYSRGGVERLDAARAVLAGSQERIAREQDAAEHARRVRRRERRIKTVAVCVFIAVLGIAGIIFENQKAADARQAASEAKQAQARLESMLGIEALRLVNPHVALLVAIDGLKKHASDGADVADLHLLAYAALQRLREQQIIHMSDSFLALAFDRDGNLLTFFDKRLHTLNHADILQPNSNEQIQTARNETGIGFAGTIEAAADGTIVLTANSSQTYVTDLLNDETRQVTTPGPLAGPVGVGTMSRDGSLILTTKRSETTRLWRLERDPQTKHLSYSQLQELSNETDGTAVAISSDGQFLAVGKSDGTTVIYQLDKRAKVYREVQPLVDPTTGEGTAARSSQVAMLSFDPSDPEYLLAAYPGRSPRLYFWRHNNWVDLGEQDNAFRAVFSPDGSLIAAPLQLAKVVDVWRTEELQDRLQQLVRQGDGNHIGAPPPRITLRSEENFYQVAFDKQDRLAAGSPSGNVWLWDLRASALSRDLSDTADTPSERHMTPAAQAMTTVTLDPAGKGYIISSEQPHVISDPIQTPLDRDWSSATDDHSPSDGSAGHWLPIGNDVSPDGRWLVLTPRTGLVLLYDLTRADRHPIAAFGKPDTAWAEPARFGDPPTRIVATPRDGQPVTWQYFETTDELLKFSDKSRPFRVELEGATQVCKVELSDDSVQELNSNLWPALTRVMSDTAARAPACPH